MLPGGLAPSWVMPRAKFDLDFENRRYWGGDVWMGDATLSTKARTSLITPDNGGFVQYVEYPDGILRTFPSYANRIVPGRGLLVEDFGNNWALWCRDFTNAAWSASGITPLKNQQGAALDNNSASSLTATGANGTILQSVTLTSRSLLVSCYVKRLIGTGTLEMTTDNGVTWTDITSQVVSGRYTRIAIPAQTLANPIFGFRIGTSGDSIAVDFFQVEAGARQTVPSSPLLTTSSIGTRQNEHISFYANGATPNAGQRLISEIFYSGKPFSTFCKYWGNPVSGGGGGITMGTDGTQPMGIQGGGANGAAATYALTTTANVANTGTDNWNKLAARTNGFGSQSCLNGGAITALASTGASKVAPATLSAATWTHGSFGNNGSGTTGAPLNGYVARVTLWDLELTDGQLLEYTR